MVRRRFTRKRNYKRKTLNFRTRNIKLGAGPGERFIKTSGTRVTGTHLFKRVCSVVNPVHTNVGFDVSQGVFGISADDAWVYHSPALGGVNVSYFTFAMNFTLDMLPNYTEFTVLFDQYRINGVKLKITPFSNQAPTQLSATAANSNQSVSGFVHYITDYDDSTTPNPSKAGIDAIRQFQSYKCKQLFRPGACLSRYIKPHIAVGAYSGVVFTSFMNKYPQWIDTNSPGVEHYGIKGIFELFEPIVNVSGYYWFKVEATMYLSFKNPR